MPKAYRKNGQLHNRSRLARKLRRDRKIYRFLRTMEARSIGRHHLFREEVAPLSVYSGKAGHPRSEDLTLFPVTHQPNSNHPMPNWEDLSPWLKCQLLVMACSQWELQTFSVIISRDLADEWIRKGADVRKEIRERMRKHIGRIIHDRKPEYFFVIEGWSTQKREQTRLHIHGGVFVYSRTEGEKVMEAVGKACGQGLHGRKPERRAVHGKMFWRQGPRYVDYLFKSVRRPDQRLERRRITMSREAVGAAREFWKLLTVP